MTSAADRPQSLQEKHLCHIYCAARSQPLPPASCEDYRTWRGSRSKIPTCRKHFFKLATHPASTSHCRTTRFRKRGCSKRDVQVAESPLHVRVRRASAVKHAACAEQPVLLPHHALQPICQSVSFGMHACWPEGRAQPHTRPTVRLAARTVAVAAKKTRSGKNKQHSRIHTCPQHKRIGKHK